MTTDSLGPQLASRTGALDGPREIGCARRRPQSGNIPNLARRHATGVPREDLGLRSTNRVVTRSGIAGAGLSGRSGWNETMAVPKRFDRAVPTSTGLPAVAESHSAHRPTAQGFPAVAKA